MCFLEKSTETDLACPAMVWLEIKLIKCLFYVSCLVEYMFKIFKGNWKDSNNENHFDLYIVI